MRAFVAVSLMAVAVALGCAVPTAAGAAERLAFRRGTPAQCVALKGACKAANACAGGTQKSGYCPGTQKCCIPGAAAPAAHTPSTPATPATPAAPAGPAYRAQGVDVSTAQSVAQLQCFLNPTDPKHKVASTAGSSAIGPALTAAQAATIKASVFDRFGVRMPLLNGASPIPTLKNAVTAGFAPANIHVYFISFKASEGAAKTLERLRAVAAELKDAQFGTLWLDVEDGPGYWTANTATNCKYLTDIVHGIVADKVTFPWALGIYSGLSTWGGKVGQCDMTPFKDLPFWFAAYVGKMDFSYMAKHPMPAGHGWTSAAVTQWRGTTKFCGSSVDFNIFH